MMLSSGARLGPYEIQSALGAGGMGEVYRARDTRLNRTVAVKLLSAAAADRPDRRQRFQIEARAISALNHPHICTLFDVGQLDGFDFIVMEHLDGETLDDRLTRGPLPAADVLRYATQIAGALDHAHRGGIVHRDLKPSNVMLTESGAKLLDFGLARGPAVAVTANGSSTVSFDQGRLTAEGTIVGTFYYMAPEQLEGRTADERTDIFAFGTLLYEMATGRRAFEGTSQASLIASILTEQPPALSSTRAARRTDHLPPALDHVVERCLAKNPDERWQTARDLKLELDWIERRSSQVDAIAPRGRRHHRREATAWVLAAAAILLAAGAVSFWRREQPAETMRFVVVPPQGTTIGSAESRTRLSISPDGRHLAFVASTAGRQQIWVRSLGSTEASALPGTEGGVSPVWSPDSRFIAFFAPGDGLIKKVEASGGPPRTICAAEMDGVPVWRPDGTIFYTQFRDGIFQVSGEGGTPARVTQVDKTRREMNHYWPSFLPDGRHFLYLATSLDANGARSTPTIYAVSLDGKDAKEIARMHSKMVYASGHVLFVEEGTLLAQRFDVANLRLIGEPVKIADGVGYYRTLGAASFTASENDVLAYQGSGDLSQLVWYDRRGSASDSGWGQQNFGTIRISPDAHSVAADVVDPRSGTADIWIYDVTRGVPVRFTADLGSEGQPVWLAGGRRVMFRTDRAGAPDLVAKPFGVSGNEEVLLDIPGPLNPLDSSPDGNWIAYLSNTRLTGTDLWLLPRAGDRNPRPFSTTRFEECCARFSPDSRWLAFVSNDSGTAEVYVAPVLDAERKTRISTGGGTTPLWRRDGKELFYVSADNRSIMSVPIEMTPTLRAGEAVRLFSTGSERASRDRSNRNTAYDVTPDGQRFLIGVTVGEPASSRITVVLNWSAGLER